MERKIIDFKLKDVVNIIAFLFVAQMTIIVFADYFFDFEIMNRPCEEQQNRTVAQLDVKCFEYFKIN